VQFPGDRLCFCTPRHPNRNRPIRKRQGYQRNQPGPINARPVFHQQLTILTDRLQHRRINDSVRGNGLCIRACYRATLPLRNHPIAVPFEKLLNCRFQPGKRVLWPLKVLQPHPPGLFGRKLVPQAQSLYFGADMTALAHIVHCPVGRGRQAAQHVLDVRLDPPWVFVENHRVVDWDPADPIRIVSHDEVLQRGLKDYGWGISAGAAHAHAARPDERIDLILAEKAAAFLSLSPQAMPFFLYIAFAAPHSPVNPAPEFRGRSQAGIYGDYVEQLDHCIGRVLDALDARGTARDTLVIVTSDNGAVCTREALAAGHCSNGVLLGQKTDAWAGGHRVPLIARWPGRIPAGSERKAMFTQGDIMATLAEAAGVGPPPGASPDGMSCLAAFTDPERAPAKRTEALFQGTGSYALRQGDWLYIPRQGSGGLTIQMPPRAPWGLPYAKMNQRNSDVDLQGKVQPGALPAQLYNLRDDLSQTTNRFRDQPDTARRLAARLEELLPKPKRPGKQ